MVTKRFKVRGLTLNLDGSEDHEWCEHNFGKDYRQLLAEQRETWEKAHAPELPLLQLPLVPTDGRASNSISEATKKVQEVALKYPREGDETTGDEDTDIEESGFLDLVESDEEGDNEDCAVISLD